MTPIWVVSAAAPAGYSAAFRAADLGLKVIVVERYGQLGGVCPQCRVHSLPKAPLLHVAAAMDEATHLSAAGIRFAVPEVDIDALRAHKARSWASWQWAWRGMARARKVEVWCAAMAASSIRIASRSSSRAAMVRDKTGEKDRLHPDIVAAGSQAVHLPFAKLAPRRSARIVDSTGVRWNCASRPQRLLVIGGGIIGLKWRRCIPRLAPRVDVVEMLDTLMQGPDRDLVKGVGKAERPALDKVMLPDPDRHRGGKADGLYVSFEGENAPAGPQRATT